MLTFEKDIAELLTKNGIRFEYDVQKRVLHTEKLNIRFFPNISAPQSLAQDDPEEKMIYLWEDIYRNRQIQVKSRLRSVLGLNKRLHGRETIISRLDKQTYFTFLEEHHLLGTTPAKTKLGLYHKQNLVAVAGFGRPCPIDYAGRTYRSSELIRFCNKSGLTVVGGLSKLLEHFIRESTVEHLMTYVDREWSTGEIYQKLGFRLVAVTPPQEFYLSPDNYQRYRFTELPTAGFDSSNWQKLTNLGNNKYVKILS